MPVYPGAQWVLTVPHAVRHRLAYNSALLGKVTRAFLTTVLGFYKKRCGASGAVAVVQRTSSDLKCNPHIHAVFLDGGYVESDGELTFQALGHLRGREVAEVLGKARKRIERLLAKADERPDDEDVQPMLASIDGRPPAGPALRRRGIEDGGGSRTELCAQDEGFNLHAATTAGGADARGREALLKYILRPPIAQERVVPGPDNLVRIALKRPFSDGTIAIDLDPLSLLLRLCSAVPAPKFHTVRYAGCLASASKLRPKIVPHTEPEPLDTDEGDGDEQVPKAGCRYWGWAELMARTFELDVTVCPTCGGHMKLVALVKERDGITRLLRSLGEPTDTPARSPPRPAPFYRSPVIRRLNGHDVAVA